MFRAIRKGHIVRLYEELAKAYPKSVKKRTVREALGMTNVLFERLLIAATPILPIWEELRDRSIWLGLLTVWGRDKLDRMIEQRMWEVEDDMDLLAVDPGV